MYPLNTDVEFGLIPNPDNALGLPPGNPPDVLCSSYETALGDPGTGVMQVSLGWGGATPPDRDQKPEQPIDYLLQLLIQQNPHLRDASLPSPQQLRRRWGSKGLRPLSGVRGGAPAAGGPPQGRTPAPPHERAKEGTASFLRDAVPLFFVPLFAVPFFT